MFNELSDDDSIVKGEKMSQGETITHHDDIIIKTQPAWSEHAHIDKALYETMYVASIKDPDGFWKEQAHSYIDWITPFTKVKDTSFEGDVTIKWFEDGKLNVSYNCIDRHLKTKADKTAIIWEGDEPGKHQYVTYQELYNQVVRFANILKSLGVKKGDRVIIYMPMILEAAYAMLACTRIGAVHSVVFGGFSPQALKGRIEDCGASVVITADEGLRGGKKVPLKKNVDEAITELNVNHVLVVRHTHADIQMKASRDVWYHDMTNKITDTTCPPEVMSAEDPLFILYTSGSTGKPKGVLHTTAGYLLYAAMTHKLVFDCKDHDIYWCTADVGWVTGHSYVVYGPLANGVTTLMYEGVPNYPNWSRCWQIVDEHRHS